MTDEGRRKEPAVLRSAEASIAVLAERLSHMDEQQKRLQMQLQKIEENLEEIRQQIIEIGTALAGIRSQQEDHQRRLDEIHYPAKMWTGLLSHASSVLFGALVGSVGTVVVWRLLGK